MLCVHQAAQALADLPAFQVVQIDDLDAQLSRPVPHGDAAPLGGDDGGLGDLPAEAVPQHRHTAADCGYVGCGSDFCS